MLKLERLEVNGFKTFVDPVTSVFAPGITAIVGPNGCGKSNLAEAVTWVLGEQSPKSLRGRSMEEVIFNGSRERKPLGMAEVNLSFLTDDSVEQAEDGRITIGRRIFRGGATQYRLNDKAVRLKDIRDLLMDTGLGIRAYSVIEQGRIGMILSGKPRDRRKLIEEAAGITRYKNRKRLAELKLEDATADLLRLNDIIAEVERSLRSLKRQANAARRFGARQEAYLELLDEVLRRRHRAIARELADLTERIGERGDREAELLAEIARANADLAKCRESIDVRTEAAVRSNERQARLLAKIEGCQASIRGNRATLAEIAERLEAGKAAAARRRADLEQAEQTLEGLTARRRELGAERDQAVLRVQEDREQLKSADAAIAGARKHHQTQVDELAAVGETMNGLQSGLVAERIASEKAVDRRMRTAQALVDADSALDAVDREVQAAGEEIERLENDLASEIQTARRVAADLEANRNRRRKAKAELAACRDELIEAQKRAAVLAELGQRDAERRRELHDALFQLGLGEARFLSDEVDVPKGWEHTLDLFLGRLQGAVLVPEDEDALAIALAVGGSHLEATLLRPAGVTDERPAVDDPSIVGELAAVLDLPEPLRTALPPAYLVASHDDAERLAALHRGVAFLCRDRLWVEAGRVTVRGEQAAPGALGRQRETDDLRLRINELSEHRDLLDRRIAEADEQAERTALESQRLQAAAAKLSQQLAVAKSRLTDIGARRAGLDRDRSRASAEHGELEREIAERTQRIEEHEGNLRRAGERRRALEQEVKAASDAVERAREVREARITAGAVRHGQLELLEERAAAERRETERTARQIADLREAEDSWTEERNRLQDRVTQLDAETATAQTELGEALAERTEAGDEASAAQQALEAERAEGRALDRQVEELGVRRDELRDELEALRVNEASLRGDLTHVEQEYLDKLKREMPTGAVTPTARGDEHAEREADARDLDELTEELERQRGLLQRMGPVNVLAATEYDEHQERHEFLIGQRADVSESVESLKRTIRDIDRTSSERFVAAFREVNENFGRTFVELFRGGEADMRLMDEDDPLDCGIEITARPPGKRPQNIMLLSGGEKALTAIALLFALFQAKPSPFCILDEVDAPLDDANILRFVDMLQRMSAETQFLVITHNKLTMQAASTLYGVTMEERGVSKIVGVDVDEMHPERQFASA